MDILTSRNFPMMAVSAIYLLYHVSAIPALPCTYLVQSHGLVQALPLVSPAAVALIRRVVEQHIQRFFLAQRALQQSRRSLQEILQSNTRETHIMDSSKGLRCASRVSRRSSQQILPNSMATTHKNVHQTPPVGC